MPSYRGPVSALLYRLLKDLRDRRDPMRQLENYYAGDHPLPFLSRRAAVRYRRLVEQARCNWPALIVDTVADRMSVEGFRLTPPWTTQRGSCGRAQAWTPSRAWSTSTSSCTASPT